MVCLVVFRTDLLQVLHHEGELLYFSLVALLPRLLLLAASVPAQTLDEVVCDGRAAVVLRRLPAQGHRGLGDKVHPDLGGGVRRVWGGVSRGYRSLLCVCVFVYVWGGRNLQMGSRALAGSLVTV